MHRNAFIELENILSLMMESYTAALGLIGESDRELFPKSKGEYVPLMDDTISIEEKRQDLIEMFNKKSSTSCAYCVGLCNGVPRVKPAQQL